MYERFKICPELTAGQYCFVLERYLAGEINRLVHEHVPKSRLSLGSAHEVLRALVSRFYEGVGMTAQEIIHSRLNNRSKRPPEWPRLDMHVAYNEPGVLRVYCGEDTIAWFDVVVSKEAFSAGRED